LGTSVPNAVVLTRGYVTALAFTGDGRQLIAATREGVITVYQLPVHGAGRDTRLELAFTLTAGPDIHTLSVSAPGDFLAAVGYSGAWIYRTSGWQPPSRVLPGKFESASFSRSGKELALIEANTVHIADPSTLQEKYNLPHESPVLGGAFTPDGTFF